MTLRILLFIGLGGMVGSVARYCIYWLIHNRSSLVFPLGTFVVNVVGGILIGVLYARYSDGLLSNEWRALLITGLCGGFTTFSAFSYDSLTLLKNGHMLMAFTYIGGSVILCLAATALGFYLAKG